MQIDILAKNLLILASAGSGKTFQLGNRVIGRVAQGAEPEKIVALTFTRKAAGEFADSVLTKLADAASDPSKAETLRGEIGLSHADFGDALERVVRALPRLTFGTMDSFFAKVVRGFQYELGLTGGRFDLLEGSRAAAAMDEILAEILGETLEDAGGEEFLHAFRRATMGREDQKIIDGLRSFVASWQGRFRQAGNAEWGPESLAGASVEDWETQKKAFADKVKRGLDGIDYNDKRQRAALEKVVDTLAAHTIGSGSLGSPVSLMLSVMEATVGDNGPLFVRFYKDFMIGGPAADALRDMVRLAAACEMGAAVQRTRALRQVIELHDARCEKKLRRRGLLGFDDVKVLMGEWSRGEAARLRREAVDFRLDARHDHWLLDEFQDTSRAEWVGLKPLLDEAASGSDGSLFIVGDDKQAIYAWRGGEVGLFDEVQTHYGDGLQVAEMAESWRSCPEVLALVNLVCMDQRTMRDLFGAAAEHWHCPTHHSAAPLTTAAKRGEARVEVVDGKWEERLERLGSLLEELGVGRRPLTCGVLLRGNAKVREVADALRNRGLDVIEEGRREPSKDNPVGIALGHLLKWLANPADRFAHGVVEMSPLAAPLRARFGEAWQAIWEGLSGIAAEAGFAAMMEQVVEELWQGWSDFGRRRAGDIIAALAGLDAAGGTTAREAADWIERLEISQSPGVAAVQVMTIHKSKGLGFDIVVLPDVPDDKVPSAQYFDVAEGDGWLTATPPKWARDIIPEMREAEERWSMEQRHEAFCLLYVALTRAKRGLYVLLGPPPKEKGELKPSLDNWLSVAIEAGDRMGVVYQSGEPDWVELHPIAAPRMAGPAPVLPLGAAIPRRDRLAPSATMHAPDRTRSAAGMRHGHDVHAAFERIGWIDEQAPDLPPSAAGEQVSKILELAEIRRLFERRGAAVDCHREQAVDGLIDGKWISGVIDRLHLHRSPSGEVVRVEIIDFKTDRVETMAELTDRHAPQMEAYRDLIQRAFPAAIVDCILISTALGESVVL
ncbi:MAG: UvrD-helicase domain-containing protein [Verrucomicrobiota bacterium]